MKLLFVGDVVASSGRRVLKQLLPEYIASNKIDFCVVNAENAAHGLGVSGKIIDEIHALGADVITLGNHTFSCYDFIREVKSAEGVVRPANTSRSWPGKDFIVVEKNGFSLAVINLMGQVDMSIYSGSPFETADRLLQNSDIKKCNAVFVDFHAEATSEKQALGYYLDGRVSAVCGTHTHVQTADSRVLEHGTGYITDVGMSGCTESIIGMDVETSLTRFVDKLPAKYKPAEGPAFMCGAVMEINSDGRCLDIRRVCEYE